MSERPPYVTVHPPTIVLSNIAVSPTERLHFWTLTLDDAVELRSLINEGIEQYHRLLDEAVASRG